jgi:2-alkenal reductase
MTVGIVSAVGRTLSNTTTLTGRSFSNPLIIQTDAAINPGNSGGPLLDSRGRVVGVNTAIRSVTGTNSGVGFAVPVNTVSRIVPQLIENGTVDYPYLGVSYNGQVTLSDLAVEFDLPVSEGVLVSEVVPGEAADEAGLRGGDETETFRGVEITLGGDIIVAVDGFPIRNQDELIGYLVSNTDVGQTVDVTIWRDGEMLDLPITLGSRPNPDGG